MSCGVIALTYLRSASLLLLTASVFALAVRQETVTVQASTDEETSEQITAEYPGWRIWRPKRWDARSTSWAATRRDESAGVDPTVIANTAELLRLALAEQRDLVERSGRRPLSVEGFPLGDAS
jgi:hypothetical protein